MHKGHVGGRVILPRHRVVNKFQPKLSNEGDTLLLSSAYGMNKITDKTNGNPINLAPLASKLNNLNIGGGLKKTLKKTYINFKI